MAPIIAGAPMERVKLRRSTAVVIEPATLPVGFNRSTHLHAPGEPCRRLRGQTAAQAGCGLDPLLLDRRLEDHRQQPIAAAHRPQALRQQGAGRALRRYGHEVLTYGGSPGPVYAVDRHAYDRQVERRRSLKSSGGSKVSSSLVPG
jgi:hypothetical protein